jgi:hypothetical protein
MVCGILVSPPLAFPIPWSKSILTSWRHPEPELQIWMGLCCCHGDNHDRLHLVHRQNNCLAVRLLRLVIHSDCEWTDCLTVSCWVPFGCHRTQFRKQANQADNKGATVAVDSLINYEAVKVGYYPWACLRRSDQELILLAHWKPLP